MFEPEDFQKQMYCIEESTCALLRLFGAPIVVRRQVNCAPLSSLGKPLCNPSPNTEYFSVSARNCAQLYI